MDTRYGPSVYVTIHMKRELMKVFLAKRFSKLTEEDIEAMRKMKNLTMEKKSGDDRSPIIIFSSSDDSVESQCH